MAINPTTLKALIDAQITNETVDFSITPTEVGSRMKDTIDYTTEQIDALELVEGPQGPQGVQGPAGPLGPVGPAGLEWQGSWVSGTSYVADDAVGYDGASWFCILATSGTTAPDVDSTHWALLASQGADGPQGVQGPTGAQGSVGPAGPQGPAGVASQTLQQTVDLGNTVTSGTTKTTLNGTSVSILDTNTLLGNALFKDSLRFNRDNGSGTTKRIDLLSPTNIVDNRTITLPDASGTIALVDYKVYSALISQSGTGVPTAKILKNTTGATFAFTRTDTGSYTVTASSNVFTTDKTASIYSLNTGGSYSNAMMNFWYIGATFFSIETLNASTLTDGVMTDTFIEIRIYN